MPVTLFLTRNPLKEFVFRKTKSGRFGELIVVNCPKVESARIIPGGQMPMGSLDFSHGAPVSTQTSAFPSLANTMAMPKIARPTPPSSSTLTKPMQAITRPAFPAMGGGLMTKNQTTAFRSPLTPDTEAGKQYVKVQHGVLEITFKPVLGGFAGATPVLTAVKRFTTMERYKADIGSGYYVQLHPSPKPYWISNEPHNSVVKGLRDDHDGHCFRVHGGKSQAEKGILIHEAPHVGWVIGCIGPRPLGNFSLEFQNKAGNESAKSMDELFKFVGHERADFFVLDW